LALLDPSPWNRRLDDDPDLPSLAESIRAEGILQPLVARPVGDRFQLLCGHRRRLAATMAGLIVAPVCVRTGVDDQRAKEIAFAENLQRRDFHFLEEADLLNDLLAGSSHEALAARLGKPRRWIARRARLANLSERWRKLVRQPTGFASCWTASHCEEVALLEPEAQDEVLETCRYLIEDPTLTVKELARTLGQRSRTIASFPWKASDADLDPKAGPCATCPARSSQNPTLFEAFASDAAASGQLRVERGDRCLNPACAQRKLARHLEREHALLAARHQTVLHVADASTSTPDGAVAEWRLVPVKRSTAGAVPGLLVSGPRAGTVKWYREPKAPKATPPRAGKKRSLPERKAQLERQRQALAIGSLKDDIRQAPPPSLPILMALAITFGTQQVHRQTGDQHDAVLYRLLDRLASPPTTAGCDTASAAQDTSPAGPPRSGFRGADADTADFQTPQLDLWLAFDQLAKAPPPAVRRSLWARLLPVLLVRMTPDGLPDHIPAAWRDAVRTAGLLGIDPEIHLQRATATLPDRKSWAQEEAHAAAAAGSLSRHRLPRKALHNLPAPDAEDSPAVA
jgi:ParB family chromosome partitioning protein